MKQTIASILDHYFPDPPIPLSHSSTYTLLIAVVLSARCTDAKVNQVTPVLFAKASCPEQMILLNVDQIQAIIKPCGLSRLKAERIWELSKILIDDYQGEVPSSLEELEKLPGVGHKTACVVLTQAFHSPAFPVDTHIYRCARRWGISKAKSLIQVEEDLKKFFPKKKWIKAHLQIIYFARAFCRARRHQIKDCPICSSIQKQK